MLRLGFWCVLVAATMWISVAAFLQSVARGEERDGSSSGGDAAANSNAQASAAPNRSIRSDLRDLGIIPKVDLIVPLLSNTLFFTIGKFHQRIDPPALLPPPSLLAVILMWGCVCLCL